MNLQSSEYADNKGFCEDLTEGKFSFPVVHGVRADQGNRQILSEPARQLRILFLSYFSPAGSLEDPRGGWWNLAATPGLDVRLPHD